MKVTARKHSENLIALDCVPRWGKPYTVYAYSLITDVSRTVYWRLTSGRECSRKMLHAIDQLPLFPTA